MFADVGAMLAECKEKGLIPYIGGDFNSRPGDLNDLDEDSTWKYEPNVDISTNKHGRTFFKDICYVGNVKPINALKFCHKEFDNDFTFIRSNGKSQIDFCLTNPAGRRHIRGFKILSDDWHISDHRPIQLKLEIEYGIDTIGLLKRASDLNYSNNEVICEVQQFKGRYDLETIGEELVMKKEAFENSVEEMLGNCNVHGAIDNLDEHIKTAHRANKVRGNNEVVSHILDFGAANKLFEDYVCSTPIQRMKVNYYLKLAFAERKKVA